MGSVSERVICGDTERDEERTILQRQRTRLIKQCCLYNKVCAKSITSLKYEFCQISEYPNLNSLQLLNFTTNQHTSTNYTFRGIKSHCGSRSHKCLFVHFLYILLRLVDLEKKGHEKHTDTRPLCRCTVVGIHWVSVWAALHPHCPKAVFLIILMRQRSSNLCCRAAAYAQGAVLFTLYLY